MKIQRKYVLSCFQAFAPVVPTDQKAFSHFTPENAYILFKSNSSIILPAVFPSGFQEIFATPVICVLGSDLSCVTFSVTQFMYLHIKPELLKVKHPPRPKRLMYLLV